VLECVVNVSEGRCRSRVRALADAAGTSLLDLHVDPWHNRSVLTLAGARLIADVRVLAEATVALLDISQHTGVHPRIGVLDVVPFVPVATDGARGDLAEAIEARDDFAHWAGKALALPCFCYGPERSLPEIRHTAFHPLLPDAGPAEPHPSAGAACVGARSPLVAYNLWLADRDLALARRVASAIRGPAVRALGLEVGSGVQVSCNLVSPLEVGPDEIYDAVDALATVDRAELVGLVPRDVLHRAPAGHWPRLDLAEERTIEYRLADAGRAARGG